MLFLSSRSTVYFLSPMRLPWPSDGLRPVECGSSDTVLGLVLGLLAVPLFSLGGQPPCKKSCYPVRPRCCEETQTSHVARQLPCRGVPQNQTCERDHFGLFSPTSWWPHNMETQQGADELPSQVLPEFLTRRVIRNDKSLFWTIKFWSGALHSDA